MEGGYFYLVQGTFSDQEVKPCRNWGTWPTKSDRPLWIYAQSVGGRGEWDITIHSSSYYRVEGVLIAYKPIIRFIDPCASSVEMIC